jgi:acyl-lipid omega-6 desaturase (Delta-12 desaturase)
VATQETIVPSVLGLDIRREETGPAAGARRSEPAWADELARYACPSLPRSLTCLASSLLPYVGMLVAVYFSLKVSVFLALGLGVLTAGFLLRTYIVFHDCAHGSFLPSKRANIWLGSVLGVLVYSPFHRWRHSHAIHHATAADLDRRGDGDVPTLTVAEYNARDFLGRLRYRLFRNPIIMFGLGPLFAMIIGPRVPPRAARARMRRSVHATNAGLAVLIVGACLLVGWRDFLIIQGPAAMLAGSAGIWLFYVQHQFEDTLWERNGEWSYLDAALQGSSYLKLPRILQFFTGSIGLHHVHHLNAKIPNYNLQAAHEHASIFSSVPSMSIWDGLRATQLKLWDEDSHRLLTFAQARATSVAPARR